MSSALALGSPAFSVAIVRPSDPRISGLRIEPTPNGFVAHGVTLYSLLQEAYAAYDQDRLSGGPAWIKTEKFDLQAKFDEADLPPRRSLTPENRRAALRSLLANEFKLSVGCSERQAKVYGLRIASGGVKVKETDGSSSFQDAVNGGNSLVTVSLPGHLEGINVTMQQFADLLRSPLREAVIDQTGITKRFDFVLRWSPEEPVRMGQGSFSEPVDRTTPYPALPTALRDQLGLTIVPIKMSVQVFIVEHAERPIEN